MARNSKSRPGISKLKQSETTSSADTKSTGPDLQILQEIRKAEVSKYNTVKNTEASYNGQIARGRAFLKNLVEKRRKRGNAYSDEICTDILEKAFDNPPNEYSALALEMFLVQKCFTEECGVSTADSIHGAFTSLWDHMDREIYQGPYSLDEHNGKVKGCPGRALSVKAVVQSVKTRAKSKGTSASRNHADAITIEEITKLMQWSAKECSDEMLTAENQIKDVETLKQRLEHGLMRAFMSSAFTLWTRCFELLSLQACDLDMDCQGPSPYCIRHFKVHLTNRKGWQHEKGYDGPRTSNIYDIYQQEILEIDMNTHLLRWNIRKKSNWS